jgi:hypothetical protein
VRAALRDAFARWGLPGALRVDNGPPWGSWGDLPPDLALWALGLGVAMVWNRPRHCQANGVVERGHGVCQQWVDPATCADLASLQRRLDWAAGVQRERYPAIDGASRLAAYPALAAGGRAYAPEREEQLWDERRVWAVLEGGLWRRRVDRVGRISLYNRAVPVGRRHAGERVSVRLRVERGAPTWVVCDDRGHELSRRPAPELSREAILALAVSRRRRAKPAQPSVAHEA